MNIDELLESIVDRLQFTMRAVRYFWQRRTRGWDDSETWSLDVTIAKFALPRLKVLKATMPGYHGESPEEWDEVLDKMIWSMDYIADGRQWGVEQTMSEWEAEEKRCDEGVALFGKYFRGLWS